MWRVASNIEDLKENPNKFTKTEQGQRVLAEIERLVNVNENVDEIAKWILREARSGRIQFDENGEATAVKQVDFDEETKTPVFETIGPLDLPHIADWYVSDSPTRQGLDLMNKANTSETIMPVIEEWDKELASKMEEENAFRDGTKTVHQFQDGWRIVQLTDSKQCKNEGNLMGHCVGGYNPQTVALLSLRDAKNNPKATIEVRPQTDENGEMRRTEDGLPDFRAGKVIQIQGKQNAMPKEQFREYLKEWFASFPEEERPYNDNRTERISEPRTWDEFQLWRDPEAQVTQNLHPTQDHGMSLHPKEAIEYGLRLTNPAYSRSDNEPSWQGLVQGIRDEFTSFESQLGDNIVYRHTCPNCHSTQAFKSDRKLNEEELQKILQGEEFPEGVVSENDGYRRPTSFQVNENGNCPGWGDEEFGNACNAPIRTQDVELEDSSAEREKWEKKRQEMLEGLPAALQEEEQFDNFQEAVKNQLSGESLRDPSFEKSFYQKGIYQSPNEEESGMAKPFSQRFFDEDGIMSEEWREDDAPNPQEQWINWDLLKTLAPDVMQGDEGLLTRYPDTTAIPPLYRRDQIRPNRNPFPNPDQLSLFESKAKTSAIAPVYYRWSFGPKTGVTLSHNESKIDALMNYRDGATSDSVDGYAYRIGNGWRLTDQEHRPVEDPYVVSQVVRKLQNFEKNSRKESYERNKRPSQRHRLRQRRERVLGRRR